jgi:glycosyltransferase involved in cell wall biosynthesis
MLLSVLLCTHQPRADPLGRVLDALRRQTLPTSDWELLLVDNASPVPVNRLAALDWHPHGRIVLEPRLGLTHARARGIALARGDLLVFCDDDNLLEPDYLAGAETLFAAHPRLGAAGGRVLPEYAAQVPEWFAPFAECLALRDLGDRALVASWQDTAPRLRRYPACAPLGAGLVLRHDIALGYTAQIGAEPLTPDRTGAHLGGGGDCAMVLAALEAGWDVGYFPELRLTHLIPAERLRLAYLAALSRDGSESWVRLLARHGLSPWRPIPRWTVPLRQARAFFAQKAWRGPADYVRWAGACGLLRGQAKIGRASNAELPAKTSPSA